jgi:hypothetical protein
MSFILSAQLDADNCDPRALWQKYQEYVRANERAFTPGAFALATAEWFFGSDDHRAPHDAWLESAVFAEPSAGSRSEIRSLNLRVRLLGAYHDQYLELFYPHVYSYTFSHSAVAEGHFDWRYHELRISERGRLVHEIEWAGRPGVEGRWLLEVSDVQFTTTPRNAV